MNRIAWTRAPATALASDAALASDWNRLNAARSRLAFLDAAAMSAALAAFGSGDETLFVGNIDRRTVAMFVLAPEGRLRWITFQPSQMPLGAWVAEPSLSLAELGCSLIAGPLGLCVALSITQIDPELAPQEADAGTTEHSHYIETGFIDLQGSFDDYWAARGKNLRQNLRKQRNKLAAEGTRTTMRLSTEPAQMAGALERYGRLESAGWKADAGTAVRADNDQGRFYAALFGEAARRGEAAVFEYLFESAPAPASEPTSGQDDPSPPAVDGGTAPRTVAVDLCLLRDGVLVVLKTTYDESIKLFSPASLLREEELQWAFGEGRVRRIEYYGRLMEWHTKLTEQKRSLHHLTIYRWAWLKRLAERRRAAAAPAPVAVEAT